MDRECLCAKQTAEEEFTPEQWRMIDRVAEKFRRKPGALIPVLEEVQGITGYLPESVQRRVASGLSNGVYHEAARQAPDPCLPRDRLPCARGQAERGTCDAHTEDSAGGVHGGPSIQPGYRSLSRGMRSGPCDSS